MKHGFSCITLKIKVCRRGSQKAAAKVKEHITHPQRLVAVLSLTISLIHRQSSWLFVPFALCHKLSFCSQIPLFKWSTFTFLCPHYRQFKGNSAWQVQHCTSKSVLSGCLNTMTCCILSLFSAVRAEWNTSRYPLSYLLKRLCISLYEFRSRNTAFWCLILILDLH